MPQLSHLRLQDYGVAVLSVATALLLMFLLDPVGNLVQTPFLLFFGAVVVTAWKGGARAGIVATLLSGVLITYLFLPPFYSFSLNQPAAIRLIVFIVESVAISALCGSLRTANQRLDRSFFQLREREDSLRQANQHITDILESITDGFFALDMQWRFAYVNHQIEQMMGRSRDELVGRSLWEVLPNADDTPVGQNIRQAQETQQPVVFETTGLLDPHHWYEIHVNPMQDGLAVYVQDLTYRKRDELLLRQHMQMLDFAVDSIIIHNLENDTIRYWNQGAVRLYGWSSDEAQGQVAHELLHTEFPESIQVIHETIFDQGFWEGELVHTTRDGRRISVNSRWTLQRTATGQPNAIVEINYDITDRKRAEEALRFSESKFQRLVDANIFGLSICDFSNRIVFANNALLQMIGYSREEFEAKGLSWIDLTPPEMLERDRKAGLELDQKGIFQPFEKDYIHKEGHRVPILIGGALLENPSDQDPQVICFYIDLTPQKQAEAALAESEQLYRAIGETIDYGIWVSDPDGKNTYASDSFLNLLGITQEECSEFGWSRLLHPDDAEETLTGWRATVEAGTLWDREHRFLGADGAWHPVLARGVPVRNLEGEIKCWAGINLDISRQKQVEADLRASENRFRALVEHAPDAIFIADPEGIYIDVNESACRLLDYRQDELIGKHISEILLPDDVPRLEVAREELLKGQPHVDEWHLRRRDGSLVLVEVSTKMLPDDRWQAFVRDITDRKKAEEALRRSEMHFRTLADTMPQIVWTAQPDGYIDYFNRRWIEYTGLSLDQSQGWGWQPVIHPSDRQLCIDRWLASLQSGEPFQMELRLHRAADRQYRWHLGRAFPMRDEDGQIIRWFGSSTDIHDQKMALVERSRALERERAARAKVEAASRSKDEFLAILSHELRSPLNPILGWVSLLRSRKLDEATRTRALETIERNAKLQTQLIEDLLDVSRILRGKLPLNIQVVDLTETVEAALETVRLSAEAKNITLHTDFSSDIGPITGDQNRLQQIAWNLLSNAVKFTPEGGHVTVRLMRADNYAIIQVQDTGKGIHPDFLPYVFERFQQADSTTTREFGGLGLGLAIVRYITELHGGTVSVESPGEGQGATFRVCLPIKATWSTSAETARTISTPASLDGITALIVDDDRDLLELLTIALQGFGAEVQIATSAQAGLRAVDEFHPDVLISDIGMPNMDGYMLIQELRRRSDEHGGRTPAIALTSYAGDSNSQEALKAGFQRHMAKPVELEELKRAIAELVYEDSTV